MTRQRRACSEETMKEEGRIAKSEFRTATVRERPDPQPCKVCGQPTTSKYALCTRTEECYNVYRRAQYAANPERILEQQRAWRAANRERLNERRRAWLAANRERIRIRRGYLLVVPRHKRQGHLANTWDGGRRVPCAICGRNAGWRKPNALKKNKTGFRCPEHRGIQIKEDDYDPVTQLQIRPEEEGYFAALAVV